MKSRRFALLFICVPLLGSCGKSSNNTDSVQHGPTKNTVSSDVRNRDDDGSPSSAVEGQSRSPISDISSHKKMVQMLGEIAARTLDESVWLGSRWVNQLRKLEASLPTDASDAERFKLLYELGLAEVRLGNEQRAIENLQTCYDMMPAMTGQLKPQDVHEITYRLGMAYMRLGETENCCLLNSPESCIIPIREGGIHTKEKGSREAIRLFTEVLQATGGKHLRARWLLNIAFMTLDRYPDDVPVEFRIPPEVFESKTDFPRFKNIAGDLGLDSFNQAGSVVVDDFDKDGYLDVLTSTYDSQEGMHLFKNNRDGTFQEVTKEAGLTGILGGINMVHADYDNDGDPDVFVMRGSWQGAVGRHPNSLLENNGDGVFTDVTFAAGLGEVHFPTHSAAWADYDNDGDVDLYVANEVLYKGRPPVVHAITPTPSQLFRNNGDGTFSDVAAEAGVENRRYPKGVGWGDYDGDRFPDLFVSNFRGPNRLYRNNTDGTFTDVAPGLGVERPISGFSGWFWDFDNDGNLDLYAPSYNWAPNCLSTFVTSVLDLPTSAEPPRLYRGTGNGRFVETANEQGLTLQTFAMGANFGDLDNDGYLDFYLGTGYPDFEALMPNVMYRNQQGKGFVDVTAAGGFGHLQKGHGISFADLDHDGDQDIFAQMGGFFRGDKYGDVLFENPGFDNRWIALQLVGVQSNRSAIGARIRIEVEEDGEPRSVYKHVNSGGSFGANPFRQVIGTGRAERIKRLEVFWPTTNRTQTFTDVNANELYLITEGDDQLQRLNLERFDLSPSKN